MITCSLIILRCHHLTSYLSYPSELLKDVRMPRAARANRLVPPGANCGGCGTCMRYRAAEQLAAGPAH